MFRSNNVTSRIFERQISTPAPGTSIHRARLFYENIVPSDTVFDVECPDHSFCKFTEDGLYLITFSRDLKDLIVYRPKWLSFSCSQVDCDAHELPEKTKKFESFFTQQYSVSLASSGEVVCKEFFLYLANNRFGLFATSTVTSQVQDAPTIGGALYGIPSFEKITFHLLRLDDGAILDERVFSHDCINLAHSMGVHMYDNLLAVLSLRYQRIHILQVRDSGDLVDVRCIGEFCHEDDELFLNSSQVIVNHSGGGFNHREPIPETSFMGVLKQRLLSFIFRGIWNEESDPTMRMQSLKKKFYLHFQDYVDLIIWKVQFLDRYHLLIKFGSVDVGISRNADNHPAFFAVYNMETTEIVAFYQNSAEELYLLFELFCDHFHASSRSSLHTNFISSHSNNVHALEQLQCSKSKASSFSQFVKKVLSTLPCSCQSQSPSPYFDQSLFRYDEKLISASDRHRQSIDHPIKFISRRQANILKFKIKTGPESGNADGRSKKISSFLFHPIFPLAVSIQHTLYFQPAVVNIHFRQP
ncbi:unnamed protein product [Cuscuta campestris]|uniref:Light-mediated development protein DET1 n=1 Tax=Cuscuta campestris TaxID=132261 RepID=A0A484KAT1_9ASTE|nr:unnamed protein product [Cuscuta campestris]